MHSFIDSIVQVIASLGYLGVFFGMLLESTFLPVPSEVIMIPAGYLASQGQMSLILLILFGTSGAIIGATINYCLGKYLGGPAVHLLIKKYGKYVLLSEKHYHKTEDFFEHHGSITTFTGRLLPGLRHLISIPAGVFHMNFKPFFIYTLLGAGIWNILLIGLGYIAGQNKELIASYSKEITFGIVVGVALLITIYVGIHKRRSKNIFPPLGEQSH